MGQYLHVVATTLHIFHQAKLIADLAGRNNSGAPKILQQRVVKMKKNVYKCLQTHSLCLYICMCKGSFVTKSKRNDPIAIPNWRKIIMT